MSRRIVVVGDVMADVVARLDGPIAFGSDTPARIAQRGGGAAANVAVWLARAGAAVTLVGRVGADAAGAALAGELAGAGVDARLQVDPEQPTGTCVVLVAPDGERSMLPDPGANARLQPAALPPDAAHVHVAGYALLHPGSRPGARAMLALAREAGASVSVDPSSAAPLDRVGAAAFLGWAGAVDLLLPNHEEARVLGGATVLVAGGAAREVVVTLGAGGARWTDGTHSVQVPAAAASGVVDTTGAGDAFTAGLLHARVNGADPEAQLRAGCALAARAVAQTGAR